MSANARLKRIINHAGDDDLIVTPSLFQWLVKHPEGVVLGDKEITLLAHEVMKLPRDRTRAFSASAYGCLRAQVFTFLGATRMKTIDPWLQNKFNDGTWRHLRWQMTLLLAGVLDDIEVSVYHDGYNLKGTLDGIGVHDKFGTFGFELKGVGSLSFLKKIEGPYPQHIRQVHKYFVALPEIEVFTLVYEDKMTQEWKEFIIERDPEMLRSVRREMQALIRATESETLPKVLKECRSGKGPTYRNCPYSGICLSSSWEDFSPPVQNQRVGIRRHTDQALGDEEGN